MNLTGADTVILVDLWWNPAVEDQAIGRAHRMGQEQNVEVYRMITRGTIEEKIQELQASKRTLGLNDFRRNGKHDLVYRLRKFVRFLEFSQNSLKNSVE